jgi:hypothetical protein
MKGNLVDGWRNPLNKTILQIFLHMFFPMSFITEVFVGATSALLVASGLPPSSIGEFLCILGIKLLMATVCGFLQDDFWGRGVSFDMENNQCPYRHISKRRYDNVCANLSYTGKNPPHILIVSGKYVT